MKGPDKSAMARWPKFARRLASWNDTPPHPDIPRPAMRPGGYLPAAALLLAQALAGPGLALAEDAAPPEDVQLELDEVSVTATRIERKTAEVPASVTVINSEAIDETKQFNIKEALIGTPGVLIESGNQGYDSRLIIRGAGLKAPYGVREIMVLRDGVPVTDPDSFTRLDMIDTQLIDRIEVVKGPNSTLWGANAAGGVINIISKSPLERHGGDLRFQAGEYDTQGYHFSYANDIADKFYYQGSISRRQSDNSWRRWNEFSTTQASLQPDVVLEDGSVWENMISYSKADLQLPGSLNEAQFRQYLRTGEADVTDGPWQYSGRYSKSYFYSSKLTKEIGDFEFIPLVYLNTWEHHHPVTGRINDADTTIGGTDLQLNYHHDIHGMQGTLTSGVTGRFDDQDTDYYKYADYAVVPGPSGRISAVLSDSAGDLLEKENRKTMLWGVYVQESLHPTDRTIVDIGVRYDSVDFDIKTTSWGEYNWSRGQYIDYAAPVDDDVDKKYDAVSPRIGLSYKLIDTLHVYASASSGVQTPTEGEISENPDLDLVKVKSYEVGLKGRGKIWTFDTAVYYSPVKNEVAKVLQGFTTEYVNAGETDKRGFEFAGSLELLQGLQLDGGYSYTDYTFEEFTEPVGYGPSAVNMDRSGNQLPFVPRHQYSLGVRYRHESGFKCSIQANSWGSYYMDNANTEKYGGYDFVTNLMVGYEMQHFDFSVNVENIFDKQYATEVTKDTSGYTSYTPAAPQTIIARIDYRF